MENNIFMKKVDSQKPVLRQIEWEMQNGPITSNGVLPISALLFKHLKRDSSTGIFL